MAVTPAEIVGLADAILAMPGEAASRSAISRYYYGAYHCALAWWPTLPGMPSCAGMDGGVHQNLINFLQNPDRACSDDQRKLSRKLAIRLRMMKERRVTADYKVDEPNLTDGEISNQREYAHKFVEETT